MIFDEEGNLPRFLAKSQTLFTEQLHRRVIWSKHKDAYNKTIFGMEVFLRAVGLGKGLKNLSKLFFVLKLEEISS